MNEFLDLLRFVYDAGAAVIPWLLLALAAYLALKTWPYVITWLQARTDAQKDIAEREAERNEILRNNSAVIRNNTETMSMIKRFVEDAEQRQCAAVERHEQLSAERFGRMQSAIDRNGAELGKVCGDVGILLDRTN